MNNKNLKFKLFFLIFFLSSVLCLLSSGSSAQSFDDKKAKQLEADILANINDKKTVAMLDDLAAIYMDAREYNQLADFLKRLKVSRISPCDFPVGYYIGLCRHNQLRFLEEKQLWQEFFDKGDAYRKELFEETQQIVENCPASIVSIRAQTINWLECMALNGDVFREAVTKLIEITSKYAQTPDVDINIIKETADALRGENLSPDAKVLYGLYVEKLITQEISVDKLRSYAEEGLKDGNVELGEIIYKRYIRLIKDKMSKDQLSAELILIVKEFATDGWSKGKDPAYAQEVFALLKEYCGESYFTEDIQYLRAYNLERLKEYPLSIEEYALLAKNFPQGKHIDEAEFKLGIMLSYINADREKGKAYFQEIIGRSSQLEYTVESLYHLSLLAQYGGNFEEARKGYGRILELIAGKNEFIELIGRVEQRQKEIKESKPIEYNLKIFLGNVFSPQDNTDKVSLELDVSPYKVIGSQEVKFSLKQVTLGTGCLSPDFNYIWSGDLGSVSQPPVEAEFSVSYKTPGVKVVNVVVSSAMGTIGQTIEMAEVYNQR